MEGVREPIKIVIVYYSRFGAVRLLAERVAEGARRVQGVEVHLLAVDERPIEERRRGEGAHDVEKRRAALVDLLTSADAIVAGAPSYFGSMASPLKRFFEDAVTASAPPATDKSRPWRHYQLRDTVGAAFTASGTVHGGNEQTLHSILTLMMHLGMIIVTPGQQPPILENEAAPYGATAITGPQGDREPGKEEQDAARDLGQRVAEVTGWLKLGRLAWIEGGGRPETAPPSPLELAQPHPKFSRR